MLNNRKLEISIRHLRTPQETNSLPWNVFASSEIPRCVVASPEMSSQLCIAQLVLYVQYSVYLTCGDVRFPIKQCKTISCIIITQKFHEIIQGM